jgi:hypothetical protein
MLLIIRPIWSTSPNFIYLSIIIEFGRINRQIGQNWVRNQIPHHPILRRRQPFLLWRTEIGEVLIWESNSMLGLIKWALVSLEHKVGSYRVIGPSDTTERRQTA